MWTTRDSTDLWSKTTLSSQFPSARILTFGYDPYVAKDHGVVLETTIEDRAWRLLSSLLSSRNDGTVRQLAISAGVQDTDTYRMDGRSYSFVIVLGDWCAKMYGAALVSETLLIPVLGLVYVER